MSQRAYEARMSAVRANYDVTRFLNAAKTGDAGTVKSMLKYVLSNPNIRTRGRALDGVIAGTHVERVIIEEEEEEIEEERRKEEETNGEKDEEQSIRHVQNPRRVVRREREIVTVYDDDVGFTPLMLAAKYGHAEVVTALLLRNNDLQREYDEKHNAEWLAWWKRRGKDESGASCATPPPKYTPMHPNLAASRFVDVNCTASSLTPAAFRPTAEPKRSNVFLSVSSASATVSEGNHIAHTSASEPAASPSAEPKNELTPLALAVKYHRTSVVSALLRLCCGLDTDALLAATQTQSPPEDCCGLYDFDGFILPPPPLPMCTPRSSFGFVHCEEAEKDLTLPTCDTVNEGGGQLLQCSKSDPSRHSNNNKKESKITLLREQGLALPLVVLPLGPLDLGLLYGNDEDTIITLAIQSAVEERMRREERAEDCGLYRTAFDDLYEAKSSSFSSNSPQTHNGTAIPTHPTRNKTSCSRDLDGFDESEIVRLLAVTVALGVRNRFVRDTLRVIDDKEREKEGGVACVDPMRVYGGGMEKLSSSSSVSFVPLCEVIGAGLHVVSSSSGTSSSSAKVSAPTVKFPQFFYPPAAAMWHEGAKRKTTANGMECNTECKNKDAAAPYPMPLTPLVMEAPARRRLFKQQRNDGCIRGAATNAVPDLLYKRKGSDEDDEGETPLHLAVRLSSPLIVKLLLSVAVDDVVLDDEENEKENASSFFCNRFLLCDPFALDSDGETPFHSACSLNDVAVLKVFLGFSNQMRRWVDAEEAFYNNCIDDEEEVEHEDFWEEEEEEEKEERRDLSEAGSESAVRAVNHDDVLDDVNKIKGERATVSSMVSTADSLTDLKTPRVNIVFIAGGGTIRSNILTQRSTVTGQTALHFAARAERAAHFGLDCLCALVDCEEGMVRKGREKSSRMSAKETREPFVSPPIPHLISATYEDEQGIIVTEEARQKESVARHFFGELINTFAATATTTIKATQPTHCTTATPTPSSLEFVTSTPLVADGFPLVFSAMVDYLLWAYRRSGSSLQGHHVSSRGHREDHYHQADSTSVSGDESDDHDHNDHCAAFSLCFAATSSRGRAEFRWWCVDAEAVRGDFVGCGDNNELRSFRAHLREERRRVMKQHDDCQQPVTDRHAEEEEHRQVLLSCAYRVVASQASFTGATVLSSLICALESFPFWRLRLDDKEEEEEDDNGNTERSGPTIVTDINAREMHEDYHHRNKNDVMVGTVDPSAEGGQQEGKDREKALRQIEFGLVTGTLTTRLIGSTPPRPLLTSVSFYSLPATTIQHSYTSVRVPRTLAFASGGDKRVFRSLALLNELLRPLGSEIDALMPMSHHHSNSTARESNKEMLAFDSMRAFICQDEASHCRRGVAESWCQIDGIGNRPSSCTYPSCINTSSTCGIGTDNGRSSSTAACSSQYAPFVRRVIGLCDPTSVDMEEETPLMYCMSTVGTALRDAGSVLPSWTGVRVDQRIRFDDASTSMNPIVGTDDAEERAEIERNLRKAIRKSRMLRTHDFERFPALLASEMIVTSAISVTATYKSANTKKKNNKKRDKANDYYYVDWLTSRVEWSALHFLARSIGYAFAKPDLGHRIQQGLSDFFNHTYMMNTVAHIAPSHPQNVDGQTEGGGSSGDSDSFSSLSVPPSHMRFEAAVSYELAVRSGTFDDYLRDIINHLLYLKSGDVNMICAHSLSSASPPRLECVCGRRAKGLGDNSNNNNDNNQKRDENNRNNENNNDSNTLLCRACQIHLLRLSELPTADALADETLFATQYVVSMAKFLLNRHGAAVTLQRQQINEDGKGDEEEEEEQLGMPSSSSGETPLHLVAVAPAESIASLLLAKCIIDSGVDVNSLDSGGCSALDLASESGNYLMARLLFLEGGGRSLRGTEDEEADYY